MTKLLLSSTSLLVPGGSPLKAPSSEAGRAGESDRSLSDGREREPEGQLDAATTSFHRFSSQEPTLVSQMLQPHPWLSQHHIEASPFVLRGTLASCSMDAIMTSLPVAADAPQPDRMQVDAVGGSTAAAMPHSSPHASASSGAGPSTEDAHMGEQAQVKPGRNASEAPLLKLSVNLIDTYKMINQVRAEPTVSGAGAGRGGG